MTIIIKPISLDDVYANDRICYNTNNHWEKIISDQKIMMKLLQMDIQING